MRRDFKPGERPSVKSVTEEAVRVGFVCKAVDAAWMAKTLGDLKPSMFRINERAAAKRTGAAPRDITMESSPNMVRSGKLLNSERYDIHTHDELAFPSGSDIKRLITINDGPREITQVIEVMDSGFAHKKLSAALRQRFGGMQTLPAKTGRILIALREANKAASNINLVGRVLLKPTPALLGLTKAKRKELSAYLEAAIESKTPVHTLKASLTRRYGRLFTTHVVPMPGYRHDKAKGVFVKRKR